LNLLYVSLGIYLISMSILFSHKKRNVQYTKLKKKFKNKINIFSFIPALGPNSLFNGIVGIKALHASRFGFKNVESLSRVLMPVKKKIRV